KGRPLPDGGQRRRNRRQRRARRGQRHRVHGVRAQPALHPQLRSAVPRRPGEDLPGPGGLNPRSGYLLCAAGVLCWAVAVGALLGLVLLIAALWRGPAAARWISAAVLALAALPALAVILTP